MSWYNLIINIFIYLFIFFNFLAALGLSWGMQDLSLWHGLFIAARGLLSSCGVQAP